MYADTQIGCSGHCLIVGRVQYFWLIKRLNHTATILLVFGSDSTHGKDGHILTIVDGQILTIRPMDGQNLTILFDRPGHFLQAGKRDDLFLWSMINNCLNLPIGTKVPL